MPAGQVNELVGMLDSLFESAIRLAGKGKGASGRSAPWWTSECRTAHQNYRTARAEGIDQAEHWRRELMNTVRKVKRQCWHGIIDRVNCDKDLYKVIGWHKLAANLRAPPLVVNGIAIEDTAEKARVLQKEVLECFDSSDDLTTDLLRSGRILNELPWCTKVSFEEVEKSVIGVSSTSPGPDQITGRLLKVCWDSIGLVIAGIFNRCLQLGYFPARWRCAEVVIYRL